MVVNSIGQPIKESLITLLSHSKRCRLAFFVCEARRAGAGCSIVRLWQKTCGLNICHLALVTRM